MDAKESGYVEHNRAYWDNQAPDYASWAPRAWSAEAIGWGQIHAPEADLRLLPASLADLDVIELGCGTAYFSAWLARHGARPVGVDASPAQLDTARRMQERFGLTFPLHLGNAEATPFADASFDLVISEYGASIWCDPYQWIPEAARLLRPGGSLIFLVNGLLKVLCMSPKSTIDEPVDNRLGRPLFNLHRLTWSDDDSTDFALPHGEWIRLLRTNGFDIEALVEVQLPEESTRTISQVPVEWARQWPAEEIWKARRR